MHPSVHCSAIYSSQHMEETPGKIQMANGRTLELGLYMAVEG